MSEPDIEGRDLIDWSNGEDVRIPRRLSRHASEYVLPFVTAEMLRQDDLWGQQNLTDGWWTAVLTEEVGEAAQAAIEAEFRGADIVHLRTELVQVAAVAVQWVAALDRRAA